MGRFATQLKIDIFSLSVYTGLAPGFFIFLKKIFEKKLHDVSKDHQHLLISLAPKFFLCNVYKLVRLTAFGMFWA